MTRTRHTTRIFVGLLVVAAVASAATAQVGLAQSSDATLTLTASNVESGTVTVTIATDAENVAGYQANLTFDSSVLRVKSVDGVDYGDPVTNVNNENGWVFLTQSQASGSDAPTFANVTFAVVGEGDGAASVSFVPEDTLMNDESSNSISPDTEPATVQVQSDGVSAASQSTQATTSGDGGDGDGSSLLGGNLLFVLAGVGAVLLVAVGVVVGQRLG